MSSNGSIKTGGGAALSKTNIQLGKEIFTIVADSSENDANADGNAKSKAKKNGHTKEQIRVIRRSGRFKGRGGRRGGSPGHLQRNGSREKQTNGFTNSSEYNHEGTDYESEEDLPSPDSPQACKEANVKLKEVIESLQEDKIDKDILLSQLEYVSEVLGVLSSNVQDDEEDLSELVSETVPEEVRKWLASTFAKTEKVVRRCEERPTFRSVANAIRTGIFIEKIYRRMSTSQLMVIPPDLYNYFEVCHEWNFDMFNFSKTSKGTPLKYLGYHILQTMGCLHKYKIPPTLLETLLGHLEAGYVRNKNPYHNNLHAADVLQTTFWFITQTGLKSILSDLEIFALLFSAIIHDYDHTGTTNNFHIQSSSSLAITYNDRSVLESHHVSAFYRTMLDNDCNILSNMTRSDFREFRSLMIEMVLHTDMSMHFSQLKHMKNMLQAAGDEGSIDKTKVLCLLLHSSDVSHPAKKWDFHYQWTSRCMEEFFQQGDIERKLGLEFSPLCDRQNTMVPQSQIGFIDFIVSPTMTLCDDMLNTLLGDHSEQLQLKRPWGEILVENKGKWQKKADDGDNGLEPLQIDHDNKSDWVIAEKVEDTSPLVETKLNDEKNRK